MLRAQNTTPEVVAIHRWIIKNLSPSNNSNGEFIQSFEFKSKFVHDGITWSVKLFPNAIAAKDSGFMTLQIYYHGPLKINARFAFEVNRNNDGAPFKVETESYAFSKKIEVLEISRFASHNGLLKHGFLVNGTFNMLIKVTYTNDEIDPFGLLDESF